MWVLHWPLGGHLVIEQGLLAAGDGAEGCRVSVYRCLVCLGDLARWAWLCHLQGGRCHLDWAGTRWTGTERHIVLRLVFVLCRSLTVCSGVVHGVQGEVLPCWLNRGRWPATSLLHSFLDDLLGCAWGAFVRVHDACPSLAAMLLHDVFYYSVQ